ncbi:helix-turn-helix domain-containing protein [Paenibacillus marinisediminis]
MDYGTRIAELREHKGWTQEELASSLGITRASLSHYEKNRRKPDFDILNQLADIFEVSIDYIIGRTHRIQPALSEDVRGFVDKLELSDEDLLKSYKLMVDGRELTDEEARRFIAFVRAERLMRT